MQAFVIFKTPDQTGTLLKIDEESSGLNYIQLRNF